MKSIFTRVYAYSHIKEITENMVKVCSIQNCKTMWTPNAGITFHSVPTNPELYSTFTSATPPELLKKVTKFGVICSKHFTPDSYSPTPTGQNRLKKKAIPTLFDHETTLSTSTSLVNTVIEQRTMPSTCTNDVDNEMPRPTTSERTTNDVGIQTSERDLAPSDDVIELRRKIKVLQTRLKRRDTSLATIKNLIRHIQKINE